MRHVRFARLVLVMLSALGAALVAAQTGVPDLRADRPTPVVDQQIAATFRAGTLTLTGREFGEAPSGRAVLLDYGSRTTTVTADSSLIALWELNRIEMSIPWEVVSGELRVVVDGIASRPVELDVYEYEEFPLPTELSSPKRPMALAVAPDGGVWLNQEFNEGVLKRLAPSEGPDYSVYDIPQASGPGIFAAKLLGGDYAMRTGVLGEDIEIDEQGRIWLTQGGDLFYDGVHPNTSRSTSWEC